MQRVALCLILAQINPSLSGYFTTNAFFTGREGKNASYVILEPKIMGTQILVCGLVFPKIFEIIQF